MLHGTNAGVGFHTLLSNIIQHSFRVLTSQRLHSVMKCHEVDSLFQYDLPGVLKLRVPGTPEHDIVKNVIITSVPLLHLFLCPPTLYQMISYHILGML